MKLFTTIVLLAATADARRRKKNQAEVVEESSGEGSGVASVTAEEAKALQTAIDLYLKNFGCVDTVTTRTAKRWVKIAAKLSKPS